MTDEATTRGYASVSASAAPDDITAGDGDGYQPILTVTPEARVVVMEARAQEADAAHLALWVDVTGVRDGVFTYDIFFQALTDAAQADVVQHDDELPVVVTARGIDQVRGARLDWSADDGGGLVILNPNTPPSDNRLPGPRGDVSGDLALRVIAVLDEQINPSIAAHGGRADLVGLQEGIAYLQLSGGCQGCGMARATLSEGIEVSLREAVPELAGVVDVTDHSRGQNPFYEPASS